MTRSTFQLTVPQDLYDAVCEDVEQPFADSYLYGAKLSGTRLTPRTVTAYHKMRDRRDFMSLLVRLSIFLEKPTPFPGAGDRPTGQQARSGS